ncbi:initiation factor 2 protein [Azorhizobium caulinodans ORS 571]|uniref:Translation initiation factor IF-2 n=5 Tax=Azorhizobium caulinodans TaxID=7 RepID=IF2_AZOC5|nr:translation initiation factor IF-2 [Azorhizobium caulinodans]A8IG20.1 RecName: Full=Translation initiation factor IF-2 [Azorhizobium caulinodans ORS 571]BAF86018.1 initiation factor 2 protein [Azorhizobium caulinodans ORS 571]
MNDTKTPGDKTLHPAPGKTLTLKRPVEQGTVRQSFSHGRSKSVVVEKVKRRVFAPGEAGAPSGTPAAAPAATPAPAAAAPRPATPAPAAPRPAAPATPAQPAAEAKAPAPAPTPAPAAPAAPVAEAPKVEAPAPVAAKPEAAPAAPVAEAPKVEVPAPAPAPAEPVAAQPAAPVAAAPAAPARAPEAPRPAVSAPRPAATTSSGSSSSSSRPAAGGAQRSGAAPQRPGTSGGPGRPGAPASGQRSGGPGSDRRGGPGGQNRPGQNRQGGSGVVLRTLTEEERNARASALADARVREVEERRMAEERRIAEEEARRRAERERAERAEREAAEARKREEESRRALEDESKRRAEQEARKRFGEETGRSGGASAPSTSTARPLTPRPAGTTTTTGAPAAGEEEDRRPRRGGGVPPRPAAPVKLPKSAGGEKHRGRLTVVTAQSGEEERQRSVASFRRRTQRMTGHRGMQESKEKIVREVVLPETITIQELANRMSERAVDVIRMLMKQGQMVKITDVIDADTAELIAADLGHTVRRVSESDVEEGLFDSADAPEDLLPRPPVVTIMGHVDHGKTSLLDSLRKANVVSGEAGGITQHIGAYQVTSPLGGKITFIDTPGHAAFTAMRARGAKVTDIVVLVVAADDGVMPQTVEAINHARAAKVPLIVAINKIDKPDAKPERVRSELLQYEVQVESMGGDTLEVEVSATKQINLDKLLEAISLQSEVLDLKANPDRPAEGTVVEAKLDRGRGPVATVLVQRGTLRVGDIVVAGAEFGRVRALITDTGATTTEAGPSVPVEVLGFNGTPEAGDRLAVVESEARAREITEYRQRQKREKAAARSAVVRGSLEQMMSQVRSTGRKEFPLIIKGDVSGSVEAIIGALEKLGNDEVQARIIHSGAGGINESDVTLAETSGAAIIGFNVRANKEARDSAERAGIEIRYYNIIYDLVDDVKKAMSGLLAPITRETMLGNALILEIFNVSKVGKVAGCRVTDGTVERGQHVRLIRDNVVIHEGKLATLNRFKDAVKEVLAGQECGMSFENYQDMRAGDVIECYRVEVVQRSL